MDYLKEYKSFVNSHYLSEGVRITVGIVLPAVVLNYFQLLSVGVVVALGAMCVSITDNPGPVHHRKNGMIACILINTIMAAVAGFAAPFPVLLGILMVLACFVFSMIAVYGSRVNSIGLSALLIMVLNIDRQHQGWEVVLNAVYIFAGGIWYMALSLLLHRFRPYKLAQQALGDCIMATASYLRVRASFYRKEVDYERTYQQMLEEQIAVHEKQNLVRELLYKSRHIIRDSTTTGRTLVMIFTDIVDLFERTMSSYQDYKAMHEAFGEDDILQKYRALILELSNELDDIGIAVKSGEASEEKNTLAEHIAETIKYFADFRDRRRTAENLDSFISLRHILNSIGDIANRIHTLHLYTTYDKEIVKKAAVPSDYDQFVSHEKIDLKILKDNLTLQSNNFRHALRISIATLAGFIVSLFFPFGHSYWILLTIIVILKPAYSLTKKRNYERVIGTIAGAVIGIGILYFVKNNDALFVIMLFLMLGTYSLWRTNYMFSVVFMTPYILLLFHLISDASFKTILSDRIIDTAIGSAIAFIANISLLPAWEQDKIVKYMLEALASNKNYFKNVSAAFIGNPVTNTEYKLSRKSAFVSLANLSDAFSRMMAEPKRKQKSIKELHQFVVLNHMLTSHIATLASYVRPLSEKYASTDFAPAINKTLARIDDGEKILGELEDDQVVMDDDTTDIIQQRLQHLLARRREELKQGILQSETQKKLTEFKPLADQFNFIDNLSKDIKVLGEKWMDNDPA
jgi:uncharacterized membrane protein (TIGR01666 family)